MRRNDSSGKPEAPECRGGMRDVIALCLGSTLRIGQTGLNPAPFAMSLPRGPSKMRRNVSVLLIEINSPTFLLPYSTGC